MSIRRQALAALVTGALVISSAACGSDGDAPAAGPATSPTASTTTTSGPPELTPEAAQALAAKMLITAKDIGPSFRIDAPVDTADEEAVVARRTPGCENIAETFLGGTQRGVGSAHHAYTSGYDAYIVDASIFADVAGARAFLAVLESPEHWKCAKPLYETLITESGGGLIEKMRLIPDEPIEITGLDVDDHLASASTSEITSGGTVSQLPLLSYTLRQGRVIGTLTLPRAASVTERQRLVTLFAQRLTQT